MAVLAVQSVPDAGNVALAAASVGGDSFQNTEVQRLVVFNAAGVAKRVTVLGTNQRNCDMGVAGTPAHDKTYNIPAGERWAFKPFARYRYNDGNERVQLTYPDGEANISVGVYA